MECKRAIVKGISGYLCTGHQRAVNIHGDGFQKTIKITILHIEARCSSVDKNSGAGAIPCKGTTFYSETVASSGALGVIGNSSFQPSGLCSGYDCKAGNGNILSIANRNAGCVRITAASTNRGFRVIHGADRCITDSLNGKIVHSIKNRKAIVCTAADVDGPAGLVRTTFSNEVDGILNSCCAGICRNVDRCSGYSEFMFGISRIRLIRERGQAVVCGGIRRCGGFSRRLRRGFRHGRRFRRCGGRSFWRRGGFRRCRGFRRLGAFRFGSLRLGGLRCRCARGRRCAVVCCRFHGGGFAGKHGGFVGENRRS